MFCGVDSATFERTLIYNFINPITLVVSMTILIAGTVDILDGGREKALSEAASLMAETRSQGGCKHYVC